MRRFGTVFTLADPFDVHGRVVAHPPETAGGIRQLRDLVSRFVRAASSDQHYRQPGDDQDQDGAAAAAWLASATAPAGS